MSRIDTQQESGEAGLGGEEGNWVGQWTGSDAWDSSLTKTEGMGVMMTWCAHAHGWPLYTYLRLREGELRKD